MPPANAVFRGKPLVDALQGYMDIMEAQYQQAFMDLINAVVNSPALKRVLNQIRTGQAVYMTPMMSQAIDAISIDTTALASLANRAMAGGATTTARIVGVNISFDITNPRAVLAAERLSNNAVVNITTGVRDNLRRIVSDSVNGSRGYAETVKAIKNEVGLLPRQTTALANFRKQLAAGGASQASISTLVSNYADRLLAQRAKTIARTEIAQSVNYGQVEFWNQMKDSGGLPPGTMMIWLTYVDDRSCDFCEGMDGQLTSVGTPWQSPDGPLYIAHGHPNCRCNSGLVFPDKIGKGGLSEWFDEKWVDLSRPKKGGGFEPCGRDDASEGKYPKCVPAKRAASLSAAEIKSAIQRKRRAESTEQRQGKKPIMVPTLSKGDRRQGPSGLTPLSV